MVDLTLTSTQAGELPKDVYVAMRVGEAQKLGRISAERNYKFPPSVVGAHRFGKIEIFQKVGGCTIGVSPERDGLQEVTVDIGRDGENRELKFQVLLKGSAPLVAEAEADLKQLKDDRPKVRAARQYLDEHNLELRLKAAMQDVMTEMPADPAAFIGEHLAQNAGTVTRIKEKAEERPAMPGRPPLRPGEEEEEAAPPKALRPLTEDEVDATAEAKAARQLDAEGLRALAKQTLMEAADSGRLAQTLDKVKGSRAQAAPGDKAPPNTEELRLQAKATLLEGTNSGRLDEVLASLKAAPPPPEEPSPAAADGLRLQAKQTLVDATANGKLEEALANAKLAKAAPPPAGGALENTEDLRQQVKDTLLQATLSGKLDMALGNLRQQLQGAPPQDAEQLRQLAQETLRDAAASGTLDAALAGLDRSNKGADALRNQVRSTLEEAASSGRLEQALLAVKSSAPSAPSDRLLELRVQARATLLHASHDGRLEDIIHSLKNHIEDDTERLRQEAKKTLLEATLDGRLEAKLQSMKGAAAPPRSAGSAGAEELSGPSDLDAEEVRQKAQQSLLAASESGKLDSMLDQLKPPAPAAKRAAPVLEESEPAKAVASAPPASVPPTPTTPAQGEEQIVAGLRNIISQEIKGAVGDVVGDAVGQLKREMEKRDEKAGQLESQMNELTRAVSALQETLGSPTSTKGASA